MLASAPTGKSCALDGVIVESCSCRPCCPCRPGKDRCSQCHWYLQDRREQQDDREQQVDDGENADAAPGEKALEEVAVGGGVEEDSGDQKAGEDERTYVHANDEMLAHYALNHLQDASAMGAAAESAARKDHGDGQGAHAIERREAVFEVNRQESAVIAGGRCIGSVLGTAESKG